MNDNGFFHFHANVGSRSNGKSAVAAAAYRAGCYLEITSPTGIKYGEKYADENDKKFNKKHYYENKKGVAYTEILAPEGVENWVFDRQQLWNAVEDSESHTRGATAQLWRDIQVGLPHYFDAETQKKVVLDFTRNVFVSKGMVADVAIHEPTEHNDSRNFHAHIMLTFREVDGYGFSKKKNREWNDKGLVEEWRKEWEEHLNKAIKAYGHDQYVDRRSYKERAKETGEEPLIPTKYKGSEVCAMERDGIETEKTAYNQGVREHNIENAIERVSARQSGFVMDDVTRELKRSGLASYLQDSFFRQFKRHVHHSQLPSMVEAFAQNYWKKKHQQGDLIQNRDGKGRFSKDFSDVSPELSSTEEETVVASFKHVAKEPEKEKTSAKQGFSSVSYGWFKLKPRTFKRLYSKFCKNKYRSSVGGQKPSSFLDAYGFLFPKKSSRGHRVKMP